MGEQRYPALAEAIGRAGDHAIGAFADVLDRLTADDLVLPDVPAGVFGADFLRGFALVDAVVPLAQALVDDGLIAIPGDRAGLASALHGAAQHAGEWGAGEVVTQFLGALAAVVGQRDVGAAGVRAGERPRGLAVADEIEFYGHCGFLPFEDES